MHLPSTLLLQGKYTMCARECQNPHLSPPNGQVRVEVDRLLHDSPHCLSLEVYPSPRKTRKRPDCNYTIPTRRRQRDTKAKL